MKKTQLIPSLIIGLFAAGIVFAVTNYTITNSDVTINAPGETEEEVFGGMPGNELFSETFSVDGVTAHYYHKSLATATNTPFALLSPGTTTTIEFLTLQIGTGTSTAANIEFATSTSAFTTTTADALIDTIVVAAGAQISYRWISVGGIVQDNIVPPYTWILLDALEEPAGGFTYGDAWVNIKLQEL